MCGRCQSPTDAGMFVSNGMLIVWFPMSMQLVVFDPHLNVGLSTWHWKGVCVVRRQPHPD